MRKKKWILATEDKDYNRIERLFFKVKPSREDVKKIIIDNKDNFFSTIKHRDIDRVVEDLFEGSSYYDDVFFYER